MVFHGQVLDGFETATVKRRLGEHLKLDAARLDHLFSGQRVVIKRSIERDLGLRHVQQFAHPGARLLIEEVETAAAAAALLGQANGPSLVPLGGEVPSTDAPPRSRAHAASRARQGVDEPRLAVASARLLGMGFQGRLARAPYVAASVMSMLVGSLIVLWAMHRPGPERLALVAGVCALLFIYGLRTSVLRCHDCNRSGWWTLLLAVPVIGWLAALGLALLRGTVGDNRFGDMPADGNTRLYTVVSSAGALALALVARPALSDLDIQAAATALGRQAEPPATATAFESEAARVYATEYAVAPNHKAFAVSGRALGWRSGTVTVPDAAARALVNCEEHRAAHTAPCELINVDDSGYRPEER